MSGIAGNEESVRFLYFRLDPDAKNAEILRLLPMLGPFVTEFKGLRRDIEVAFNKLDEMENNKKNINNNNNNHNHNNNTVFSNTNDDASSVSYSSMLAMFIYRYLTEIGLFQFR